MGSPDGDTPEKVPAEEGRDKDETPHKVTLSKGYHLGVHLVTQEQWETVLGKDANHSHFKATDDAEKKKLPVDNVSWFDCVEFSIKLSEREGRKPHYSLTNISRNEDGSIKAADVEMLATGTGYRLPTEAEWEYACRAGTKTPFWWGAIDHHRSGQLRRQFHLRQGRQEGGLPEEDHAGRRVQGQPVGSA